MTVKDTRTGAILSTHDKFIIAQWQKDPDSARYQPYSAVVDELPHAGMKMAQLRQIAADKGLDISQAKSKQEALSILLNGR